MSEIEKLRAENRLMKMMLGAIAHETCIRERPIDVECDHYWGYIHEALDKVEAQWQEGWRMLDAERWEGFQTDKGLSHAQEGGREWDHVTRYWVKEKADET